MFKILILLAFLGVLKVLAELYKTIGKNRQLQKDLEIFDKEPQVLLSKLNVKVERESKVSVDGDYLLVDTDIQLVQLMDDGEFQLRFVSELNGDEISGEIWMQVNTEVFGFDKVDTDRKTNLLIGYSRTEKTLSFLDFLTANYNVEFKYPRYKPAFGLVIGEVKALETDRTYLAHGVFNDGGDWSLRFDIVNYTCKIRAKLTSLQDIRNFPIFEFESN